MLTIQWMYVAPRAVCTYAVPHIKCVRGNLNAPYLRLRERINLAVFRLYFSANLAA